MFLYKIVPNLTCYAQKTRPFQACSGEIKTHYFNDGITVLVIAVYLIFTSACA